MEPKDRLRAAREKAGFASASEAARALRTININTLISNENGNRPISKKMAQVYGDAFNVSPGWLLYGDAGQAGTAGNAADRKDGRAHPTTTQPPLSIMGNVAAGHWLEADLFEGAEPEQSMIVGGDKRFPLPFQYLLRINGESMNKIAQDGDLVLCVDYMQAGFDLKNNDIVIVERSRDGGLTIERTAKRAVRKNGSIELRPESTDPRFQEPVIYNDHDNDTTEVRVIAKVLSVIRQLD